MQLIDGCLSCTCMLDLRVERPVAGGVVLGHHADGRVVLVEGALPGERVRIQVDQERARMLRGTVVEVLEPSPSRIRAPCEVYDHGCGGCDLQELEATAQLDYKADVVRDALRRLGAVADPIVEMGPTLATRAFRTTVRAGVLNGRAGLRARRSHDVVRVEHCMVAHPLIDEVLAAGTFPGATEVLVRAGARTRERLVVVTPNASGAGVPDGVVLVGTDELRGAHRAWYHELAAGRRWRISARSFFQTRPDGADALVQVVGDALIGAIGERGARPLTLLDAHCGVGLFGGALAQRLGADTHVIAVERSASAITDARHNLADLDARFVRVAFERWKPSKVDLAVADPPRGGLGRAGVDRLAATGAVAFALVSCDAASLGRDAGLLQSAGLEHMSTVTVDLFPHTSRVECVSLFTRR